MTKILAGLGAGVITAYVGLQILAAYERRKTEKPTTSTTPFTEE